MADPLEAAMTAGMTRRPGGGSSITDDPIFHQQMAQLLGTAEPLPGSPAEGTAGETTMFRGSQVGPTGQPELVRPGITPPGSPEAMSDLGSPAGAPVGAMHAGGLDPRELQIQTHLKQIDQRRKMLRGALKLLQQIRSLRMAPASPGLIL